jgi:CRP-like cAMP-binding protein
MLKSHIENIKNKLLSSLPRQVMDRWIPHLELVDLKLGENISDSNINSKYIYFPDTCVVSLIYITENGGATELAIVGCEGLIEISKILGGDKTISSAVIQCKGTAYRVSSDFLQNEFETNVIFKTLVLKFTQALITQMTQMAVCNRHHSLEQQLCRWMLSCLDRLTSSEIIITQELISNLLGVRREGVTEAAIKLQRDGLISYSRGRINVIDKTLLSKRSCECHGVVKREYNRLLPYLMAA